MAGRDERLHGAVAGHQEGRRRRPRGPPPNVSSGSVYMLTENAATAKMLSEMPAEAQAGPGSSGMAAVPSATSRRGKAHARARGGGGEPRSIEAERKPSAGETAERGGERRNPGVPGRLHQREAARFHQEQRGPVGPERVERPC